MNSFSGSRFGGWYFLVQALGIAGWWVYLSAEPSAVPLFLPRGAAEADLRAFQMPDLLVAVPVSLAAAVSILLSLRWAKSSIASHIAAACPMRAARLSARRCTPRAVTASPLAR